MSAVPAVVAAKRHRLRELRRRAEERAKNEEAKVNGWFARFDADHNELLDRNELTKLIEYLEGQPLRFSGVDLIFQQAQMFDTTGDGRKDTKGFSKNAVSHAVKKYMDYAREQEFLDEVFERFDTDKTGTLDKGQLRALLGHIEDRRGRNPNVSEEAVKYVLEECGAKKRACISRTECLAAVGTWMHISDDPHYTNEPSQSCCKLM